MPERLTGKEIKTLGDLREFVNITLKDLEDEYKITFDDLGFDVKIMADCDISYSNKEMSIECNINQVWPK